MLLSRARSARMACWLCELRRASSSRSSTSKPGPSRTSVAPNSPPRRTVNRMRRSWRSSTETTFRLPGAGGLKCEPARPHHSELLFLLGDVHSPVCFTQQPVGIHAVLREHRVSDAEPNNLLREYFAAGVGGD